MSFKDFSSGHNNQTFVDDFIVLSDSDDDIGNMGHPGVVTAPKQHDAAHVNHPVIDSLPAAHPASADDFGGVRIAMLTPLEKAVADIDAAAHGRFIDLRCAIQDALRIPVTEVVNEENLKRLDDLVKKLDAGGEGLSKQQLLFLLGKMEDLMSFKRLASLKQRLTEVVIKKERQALVLAGAAEAEALADEVMAEKKKAAKSEAESIGSEGLKVRMEQEAINYAAQQKYESQRTIPREKYHDAVPSDVRSFIDLLPWLFKLRMHQKDDTIQHLARHFGKAYPTPSISNVEVLQQALEADENRAVAFPPLEKMLTAISCVGVNDFTEVVGADGKRYIENNLFTNPRLPGLFFDYFSREANRLAAPKS